ncbi:MAG: sensor histidine kinase KdpD [Dehalococcoidia bacterium]
MTDDKRPDPDALLARIKREEQGAAARGHLRIYLGAFPGVGKTFAMLNEAHRRARYGEDVVVGFAETHGRAATAEQLEGLEVLPRKKIEYRGVVVEEFDAEAALARRPAVCLVDELAHTNAPGSVRQKRHEDIEMLLDAGIDVVATLNVQHLESLNDTVAAITGIRVRETVPDSVLEEADEVILVDLSPEGARARMQHGNIYPPEQAARALEGFFKPENLAALRDLALRRTTQEVDEQLEEYMRESPDRRGIAERVLVLVDADPVSRTLLRHGWLLAQGLEGELMVAYVTRELSREHEEALAGVLELAEDLNGSIHPLTGVTQPEAIAAFVRAEHIGHLVLRRQKRRLMGATLVDQLGEALPDVSIHLPGLPSEK